MTTPQSVEDFLTSPAAAHTLRLVPSSQRELFVSEFERLITHFIAEREAEVRREERERVMPWIEHDNQCILKQDDMGEPTDDGGYRTMYAGVWYKRGEEPECDCGLEHALTPTTTKE